MRLRPCRLQHMILSCTLILVGSCALLRYRQVHYFAIFAHMANIVSRKSDQQGDTREYRKAATTRQDKHQARSAHRTADLQLPLILRCGVRAQLTALRVRTQGLRGCPGTAAGNARFPCSSLSPPTATGRFLQLNRDSLFDGIAARHSRLASIMR